MMRYILFIGMLFICLSYMPIIDLYYFLKANDCNTAELVARHWHSHQPGHQGQFPGRERHQASRACDLTGGFSSFSWFVFFVVVGIFQAKHPQNEKKAPNMFYVSICLTHVVYRYWLCPLNLFHLASSTPIFFLSSSSWPLSYLCPIPSHSLFACMCINIDGKLWLA